MNRTFETEDARKDKLFEAWNEYLETTQDEKNHDSADEIFEGTGVTVECTETRIGFVIEDGRRIYLGPPSAILKHSREEDRLYLILARQHGRWTVLDLLTIGSLVVGVRSGIHLTTNPAIAH